MQPRRKRRPSSRAQPAWGLPGETMNNLSYWDLSEKERAALTEEQVRAFTNYELMQNGVIRAGELELIDEPSAPEPDLEVFVAKVGYHRDDIAWETAEQAKASIEGCIGQLSNHYLAGSESVHEVLPITDEAVVAVRAYSTAGFARAKEDLNAQKAAKAENNSRRQDHSKHLEKQDAALKGMWEDWYRCIGVGRCVAKLEATRAEYLTMTGGDEKMAETFLAKAFDADEREEAAEWA